MRYRRAWVGRATYFFTANLAERSSHLLVDRVGDLLEVIRWVRQAHPFEIAAWVVMPDHIHAIRRLPARASIDAPPSSANPVATGGRVH